MTRDSLPLVSSSNATKIFVLVTNGFNPTPNSFVPF